MSQSPQEMYWSMKPITRGYMTLAVLTTCARALGLIAASDLMWSWTLTVTKFQIWRPFTTFIYFGDFSLGFLFQVYFLVKYSGMLEQDPYPSGGGSHQGNTADYLYMMVCGGIIMLAITFLFPMYFLASSMVFMIIYVWSKRNPDVPMSFFGFKFTGMYMPWVLVAFHVLIGASPVTDLVGIAAGHVYYFVQEVLPLAEGPFHGKRLLHTPGFLVNFFHAPPTAAAAAPGWGAGRRLDD